MSLAGSVESFPLTAVALLLESTEARGILRLSSPAGPSELHLDRGALVGVGPDPGGDVIDAVASMIEAGGTTFTWDGKAPPVPTDPPASLSDLVARADARIGEWAEMRAVAPTPQHRVTLVCRASGPVTLDPAGWAAVCAIAGGCTLEELTGRLDVTPLETYRLVRALRSSGLATVDDGCVAVVAPDGAPAPAPALAPTAPVTAPWLVTPWSAPSDESPYVDTSAHVDPFETWSSDHIDVDAVTDPVAAHDHWEPTVLGSAASLPDFTASTISDVMPAGAESTSYLPSLSSIEPDRFASFDAVTAAAPTELAPQPRIPLPEEVTVDRAVPLGRSFDMQSLLDSLDAGGGAAPVEATTGGGLDVALEDRGPWPADELQDLLGQMAQEQELAPDGATDADPYASAVSLAGGSDDGAAGPSTGAGTARHAERGTLMRFFSSNRG